MSLPILDVKPFIKFKLCYYYFSLYVDILRAFCAYVDRAVKRDRKGREGHAA